MPGPAPTSTAATSRRDAALERLRTLRERLPGPLAQPVVLGLVASLVVLLLSFLLALGHLGADTPGKQVTLTELNELTDNRRIESLELRDQDAVAIGKATAGSGPIGPGGTFSVAYPSDGVVTADIIDRARESGARVTVDAQNGKQAVRLIATFLLPLMILANLFALAFLVMRGGGGALADIEAFGTLGGGRKREDIISKVTFADVAGAGEAVVELQEVVDYLRDPTRYANVGAIPPKGVLLFGPPGCGKTLIARAVAGEAGVPFFSVGGAEFVESLVGVGAARVRDLFARVREVAPAIVFIDELDAAARRRGAGGSSGGSDEREQTLNQLLVEIDGFEVSSGLVIIGATNRPDILDPAVVRPGRFDRHVTVEQPDLEGRKAILELHAKSKPMGAGVDFTELARLTPGFTGADLANVVNEAALLTVRAQRRQVDQDVLDEAIQRVLHGPQRRGRVLTDAERERAAVHEAGHAVVAAAHGRSEDIHRVSILSRGRGLGLAAIKLDADAVLFTREDLLAQLAVTFGGMAAEDVVLGQSSTGAEQDVEHATWLGREIVGRYGMSEVIGPIRILSHDADEYLGGSLGMESIAPGTHEAFDVEVRALLDSATAVAEKVIAANRDVLDAVVAELLEREMLEAGPLATLLEPVKPATNGRVRARRPRST